MRKLITTFITSGANQPIKQGTLDHLQLAYAEAFNALGQSKVGVNYDATKVYILSGCANTGSGANYIISAGAVFYNGEIYLVDAATFTLTGSNVATGTVTATFFAAANADPVDFTDGSSHNVHQINKVVIGQGLSGSGTANYLDFINSNYILQGAIGELKYWKMPGGVYSDYFDGTGLGIHNYTQGWALANGSNGTDDFGGRIPMPYKDADADFGTIDATGGAKVHTLTQAELPAVGIPFKDTYYVEDTSVPPTVTDYITATGALNGGINSNATDITASSIFLPYRHATTDNIGSGASHSILNPFKTALFLQRIA